MLVFLNMPNSRSFKDILGENGIGLRTGLRYNHIMLQGTEYSSRISY